MTTAVQSFSSIVGPNGSGKSNTIDALLFVFGFRASKMRQGKFSELIHNSGPVATNEGEVVEPIEGMEVEEESDSSGEEGYGKKGKKKGKGKGKKNKEDQYSKGGCDFATVEVWFREVIDLVRTWTLFSLLPAELTVC